MPWRTNPTELSDRCHTISDVVTSCLSLVTARAGCERDFKDDVTGGKINLA